MVGKAWWQETCISGRWSGDRDETGSRARAVVLRAYSLVTYLHQLGPTS